MVSIQGKNISKLTQKSLRENIGVVPQDTVLFNDSMLYNIRYAKRDATMQEVEKACEA